MPGSRILSVGGWGCNLRCPFCQNHEISENTSALEKTSYTSPEQIAALAAETVAEDNTGVAYTYNEPLIGAEFVLDCARLVKGLGLRNVIVTNGYINPEPLGELLSCTDAMNIDLKAYSQRFYSGIGGELEAVKRTISTAHSFCHVEITCLVIPGENDSDEEISAMARWLASLSPDIPLHLSRFFPRYLYGDRAPTPADTLYRLADVASEHLKYVFVGNI
jgi:pyruvate formate lyase activating enzyme